MERLNQRAWRVCQRVLEAADSLGVEAIDLGGGGLLLDFGVSAAGSSVAGLELARICWADLGTVEPAWLPHQDRRIAAIQVQTREPLRACMAAQYAGWQIAVDNFFAMCSGPIRAVRRSEKLFEQYGLAEADEVAVGVLETSRLPTPEVLVWFRDRLPPGVRRLVLCAARTSSIAGRTQIVARSVETACHKLWELGFDLRRIQSGRGIAPLPPETNSDSAAMGSTNDAVLLAGQVDLWIDADEAEIERIGPQIPSCSSSQFGRPFREIFAAAHHDFYQVDPGLFAPAEVTLHSARNGRRWTFGRIRLDLYLESLGP
jgi:methenyltetrahydromethanopterin cyclohydrolase